MLKRKWVRRFAVRGVASSVALTSVGIIAAFVIGYFLGPGPLNSPASLEGSWTAQSGTGTSSGVPDLRKLCDETEPDPIAFLGRLAAGFTVTDLTTQGYSSATTAIDGFDGTLVVLGDDPQTAAAAEANPALAVTGWMRARSMDVSLRSCYYRLDDKPAAVEIANRATVWMVANGVLTQAQINAGGTTFGLTDDPTNPTHLFFSVILASPGGGPPGSETASSLTRYAAVIDRASGEVLGAGRAHW